MMSDEDEHEEDNAEHAEVGHPEDSKEPKDLKEDENKDLESGVGELMEVFPTEEWVPPER